VQNYKTFFRHLDDLNQPVSTAHTHRYSVLLVNCVAAFVAALASYITCHGQSAGAVLF
jgi:hypothetical protein